MTDQVLEIVRESVFGRYKNLKEKTRQAIKMSAETRTKNEIEDLIDRIDDALVLAEREQSLLILSINENDKEYECVRILTEAITTVGDVFNILESLMCRLDEK